MWGHAKREFYSVPEIAVGYGISELGIHNCILQGLITVHTWLPPTSVSELCENIEGVQISYTKTEYVHEGFTAIFPQDYRRIAHDGAAHLRSFPSPSHGTLLLRTGVPDILVRREDVVILATQRESFAKEMGLHPADSECKADKVIKILGKKPPSRPKFDASFKHVKFAGRDFSFGPVQSHVMRQLYEAAKSDDRWISGKRMLERAGSESMSVANVFASQPFWRELIVSDRRGLYALHDDFISGALDGAELV